MNSLSDLTADITTKSWILMGVRMVDGCGGSMWRETVSLRAPGVCDSDAYFLSLGVELGSG